MNIRKAEEDDRSGIAYCIAEGFERDFSALSKDIPQVARSISSGIHIDRFYVAEIQNEIAGVAAVSDCHGRAVHTDLASYRREFGILKSIVAKLVMREEFEARLDYPSTTGYIEFVAVRKGCRRKGVASSMLTECMKQSGYLDFVLDVIDINPAAMKCYAGLGFVEFKRVKEKHGRQKGFKEKIYMKYRPDAGC